MYFHNPEYERRPQERKRVEEIARGIVEPGGGEESFKSITSLQILPPLLQLYPEVEVAHADEACLFFASKDANTRYTWLFAGRTLYLVIILPGNDENSSSSSSSEPCPFSSRMRVLHSKDVAPLLKAYLSHIQRASI